MVTWQWSPRWPTRSSSGGWRPTWQSDTRVRLPTASARPSHSTPPSPRSVFWPGFYHMRCSPPDLNHSIISQAETLKWSYCVKKPERRNVPDKHRQEQPSSEQAAAGWREAPGLGRVDVRQPPPEGQICSSWSENSFKLSGFQTVHGKNKTQLWINSRRRLNLMKVLK